MTAEQIVLKTIKENNLIQPGDSLLLGFSGGPDSLCLLDILAKAQKLLDFKLYALHVNHQIRGEEADGDMNFALEACNERNVPITVKSVNVPAVAKNAGVSVEDAGRKIRQKALKERAAEIKAENPRSKVRIVLAHNKDDQAETVLMRILRGTGVHGIAAMEYERADGLIRPLLDTPRSSVEEYCKFCELSPRIDSTNTSLEYMRNRLRYRLIPVLEREFNPNLKDGLVRLADSAREDDKYISYVAKSSIAKIVKNEDWDSMPKAQLLKMNEAVAKRIVKMMFARSGLKQDISAVHLRKFFETIKKNDAATIEFPKGYKAILEYGTIFFRGPNGKAITRPKDFKAFCKVMPIEDVPDFKELGENTCAIDAMKVLALKSDLYIRPIDENDRIKPLGLGGTKKISDYLSDKKVPREIRSNIKLLCTRRDVLWIEGYTISDLCKIDKDTNFVLVIRIQEG